MMALTTLIRNVGRSWIDVEIPDVVCSSRSRKGSCYLALNVRQREGSRVDLNSAKDAVPDLIAWGPWRIPPGERRCGRVDVAPTRGAHARHPMVRIGVRQ